MTIPNALWFNGPKLSHATQPGAPAAFAGTLVRGYIMTAIKKNAAAAVVAVEAIVLDKAQCKLRDGVVTAYAAGKKAAAAMIKACRALHVLDDDTRRAVATEAAAAISGADNAAGIRNRRSEILQVAGMPAAQFNAIMLSGKFGSVATVAIGGRGAFDEDGKPKEAAKKSSAPTRRNDTDGNPSVDTGEHKLKARPETQVAALLAQAKQIDTSGMSALKAGAVSATVARLEELLAIINA